MCTRWPDLTESPESAILPVVNEMKIDALALITVVIAAIIYVVVMMMGLFDDVASVTFASDSSQMVVGLGQGVYLNVTWSMSVSVIN